MSNWWELQQAREGDPQPGVRAIAYYRHSAQDRQENSIPIQQDQVREWAAKNGVHIIHEFADAGKSGLNAEGRPAFTEMTEELTPDFTPFRSGDIFVPRERNRCSRCDAQIGYAAYGIPHGPIASAM